LRAIAVHHQLVARRLHLATGEVTLSPAEPGRSLQVSNAALITIHGPRWRLLIIGAGQLSAFVARIALGMDYQVTVCDPREEYHDIWSVPEVLVVHAMPDDLRRLQGDVSSSARRFVIISNASTMIMSRPLSS
jgi:xanthine dehydrogenase accessory factor